MNRRSVLRGARRPALFLALLAAAASPLAAQVADGRIEPQEYAHSLSLDQGRYLLHWSVAGEIAHFGLQAETRGWVALGVGPQQAMDGADIVIGWAEGDDFRVVDGFATGPYGPHPADVELGGSDDLLSSMARQSEGSTTVEFSRRLSPADPFDRPFDPEGDVAVIWAVGDSDDIVSPHLRRGHARLGGAEGGPDAGPDTGSLYGLLLPVHGVAMAASFVLLLGGMLFPRFFKHRKWWLKAHRRVAIPAGALGLVGVGLASYTIVRTTGVHLRLLHSWVGLVTVLLLVLTPVYGQLMLKIRTRSKRYRAVHRWMGRVTLAAMAATIFLGLRALGVF